MTEPDAPTPAPLVLRTSPLALVGAFISLLVAVPLLLATPGPWSALLVVPFLVAAWVLRVRTTVSPAGIDVRTALGARHLGWEQVRGVRFSDRGWGRAVLTDDSEVALPSVRFPDLPALSTASGGRLPDPWASLPERD